MSVTCRQFRPTNHSRPILAGELFVIGLAESCYFAGRKSLDSETGIGSTANMQ